jgi:dTDP-4-dehydrorhamnose reductase
LVGSYLVRELARRPNTTVLATYAHNPPIEELEGLAEWFKYEAETDKIDVRDHDLTHIFMCAAWPNVNACEQDPTRSIYLNRSLPITFANAAAENQIHFTFFSSGYVFPSGSYTELHSPVVVGKALNQYGQDKRLAEQAIMCVHPSSLIVRTVGVYGFDPGGKCFGARLVKALSRGEEFAFDPRGVSNWTPADVLAHETIKRAYQNVGGVHHIAGMGTRTRGEFAGWVAGANRLPVELLKHVDWSTSPVKRPDPCDMQTVQAGVYYGDFILGQAMIDLRLHKEKPND